MVNITPRRHGATVKRKLGTGETPWSKADPTRRIGLNVQIPEPLMAQLDYLIENRAIFSKASFIREVVAKACEEEITRLNRVREAVKRIEDEDRRSK